MEYFSVRYLIAHEACQTEFDERKSQINLKNSPTIWVEIILSEECYFNLNSINLFLLNV
jgi:hypothetical protein